MSGDRRLQQLATELDEAINRIDTLQKGSKALPWSSRVSNHFSKHGGNILNVVVAGIAFTLAAQRLAMKHEFEAARASWQKERHELLMEKNRLEEEVDALHTGLANIITGIDTEPLGNKKSRLGLPFLQW